MVDLFERECNAPWHHYELNSVLPENLIIDLKRLPSRLFHINHTQEDEHAQNYDEKNIRYFIINSGFAPLISIFTDPALVNKLQEKFKRKLKYVRFTLMEVFGKRDVFLHCDDPEKLVTILIYLTDRDVDELGTWCYDANKKLVKKLAYKDNCGVMFMPVQNETWHSIPAIDTDDICRRGLLINYVSTPTEWRL